MKISYKAARVNAGMTLAGVAKILGVAVSTLSSYENGKTKPTHETVVKMAELYNMPVDMLKAD